MRNKTIAIDFGGTSIKMAVLEGGSVFNEAKIPAFSENGLAPRLADTEHAIRELTGNNFRDYKGIGIAMPGLVDPQVKRLCEIYNKYTDALQMDLEQWCHDRFGLPMCMEQDSKAALLGEIHYGCAKGFQDALLITLGTGVGTAVMIRGQMLDSRNHFAGSLGSHIILDYLHGLPCTCGNHGCMEAYCASYALPNLIREHPFYSQSGLQHEEVLNYLALKKWYDQNDPLAQDVLHRIIQALRAGIVSLVHCYDPAVVILSGGVLNFGPAFTEPLFDGLNDMLWGRADVQFVVSQTPDQSVLFGLDYLVQTAL